MTKPPYVLFQPEFEAMGGAERSLLALSRWMHERNFSHVLVTYRDHCNIAAHASHPVDVIELKPAMIARRKVATLKEFFATQPHTGAPLLSGYQAAMHASMAGLRGTHCLMHDTPDLFDDQTKMGLKQRVRRWFSNRIVARNLKSGGHTFVTSEHLQREVQRLFGVKAEIVRMGGFTPIKSVTPRFIGGAMRLLSTSRIEDNKRIDWLLRALAAFSQQAPSMDWHLDVLGKGSQLDALQALAASLGIAQRVTFHGYVSDEQLEVFFAQANLFLMPAVQGYGIPAIEAVSRGIPVLLHRDSGVSDILRNTSWATVFEGGESNLLPALTLAIDNVLAQTHIAIAPPPIPTEDEWAAAIAIRCGWLGA